MGKLTDEKFVSIEYDTWINKYVPMEQELSATKEELEKEKESKTHHVYLTIDNYLVKESLAKYKDDMFRGGRYQSARILTFDNIWSINIKDIDVEAIHNEVIKVAKMCIKDLNLVTYDDLQNHYAQVNYLKEETERLAELNRVRITRIPKFIKWLFKIKL